MARDWPKLKFCAYHSGYFQDGTTIDEFVAVVESIPKKERKNLYAEIGSSFAVSFIQGPDQAAHLLGKLLRALGPKRILWGTDSIWWGSPKWQIDAFKAIEIPPSMRERFGYPALTPTVKQRILGLNAAKLYGVKPKAVRCAIPESALAAVLGPRDAAPAGRSLRAYGPRTRREFLALLRHEARLTG